MNTSTIKKILIEVQSKLPLIFGDQMLFGFVCGGFSKGYADENHDVDIFVCLKEKLNPQTEKEYLDWYFDLHKRYGIAADFDYPGEIVTLDKLISTLKILKTLKLTLKIDSVQVKKAIIWADMITSKIAAEVGTDLDLLQKIRREYEKYPEQWKAEVLSLISLEEREKWQSKSHLLIMEHFMKYPKYDGKQLERFYK